ncbi:MAG: tRNA epoxyqueuosine(34) reductase QueG [Phycisphaerales bacterium]
MSLSPREAARMVRDLCSEQGFARCGICRAAASRHQSDYLAWINAGKHGEMHYLEVHRLIRQDPRGIVPGAKSIVVVADRYAGVRDHQPGSDASARGRIARYARGRDYHKLMKKRLHEVCDAMQEQFPGEVFRACVDTAPLLEREHAGRAGLGAIGKHTLLIEQGVGSWLLLGAVVTTLVLEPDESHEDVDPCSSCTRCIDACPTDAITPFSVDATRCISYLTIEHRSMIDAQFHEAMGDWLFGCDICQEVCPHNQPTRRSSRAHVHEGYEGGPASFDLLNVLQWNAGERADAVRGTAMTRARLEMFKRNALIAAGNALRQHDDAQLREAIIALAHDESEHELVRITARQVLQGLERSPSP